MAAIGDFTEIGINCGRKMTECVFVDCPLCGNSSDKAIYNKSGIRIVRCTHCGFLFRNPRPLILFDERDEEERKRAKKAAVEILKICADAGGTISGEHGIGLEKKKEMFYIFSESDLESMRQVKRAFDPEDILNPGKVIPA